MMARPRFYGCWIVASAFLVLGICVGLPYYNIPFFYDYFHIAFGWSRSEITLGFPLAALLTLWVGPAIIPKVTVRASIIIGSGLMCLSFLGFSRMAGSLPVYYFFWFLFTIGYILAGPIPNQLIVSYWFRRNRGTAMAIIYTGLGSIAALGSWLVKRITQATDYHFALTVLGLAMFLAWPIALFAMKERPADLGQFPDGDSEAPAEASLQPRSFAWLLGNAPFWLLLTGSFCSIGAIGAINFHMKFVFEDQGFREQAARDAVWSSANILILCSSMLGRIGIGILADRLAMKWVMFATYFLVAASIPLLLLVAPPGAPRSFPILFGLAMGADYMLIPLMAARQFGVNTLARAMGIILPVNTIGQTWFPYFVSLVREHSGSFRLPLLCVFALAMIGALAMALLPRQGVEDAETERSAAAPVSSATQVR